MVSIKLGSNVERGVGMLDGVGSAHRASALHQAGQEPELLEQQQVQAQEAVPAPSAPSTQRFGPSWTSFAQLKGDDTAQPPATAQSRPAPAADTQSRLDSSLLRTAVGPAHYVAPSAAVAAAWLPPAHPGAGAAVKALQEREPEDDHDRQPALPDEEDGPLELPDDLIRQAGYAHPATFRAALKQTASGFVIPLDAWFEALGQSVRSLHARALWQLQAELARHGAATPERFHAVGGCAELLADLDAYRDRHQQACTCPGREVLR